MVELIDFSKSYSSHAACTNISLTANKNEITVLLGPNGAGKSTLLKAIAGFHFPSSGKIVVPENSKIGFVGEKPLLYDEWTVSEFLLWAARLKMPGSSKKEIADSFYKAVSLCSLEEVLSQKIATLSHGFRQRVNFAQALVDDPDILILDEPATGLDPKQIHEMRTLVQKLREGRTIIFSTHIIQEAKKLSNKIYIINEGHLVAGGSADELILRSEKKDLEEAYLFFSEKESAPKAPGVFEATPETPDLLGMPVSASTGKNKSAPATFASIESKKQRPPLVLKTFFSLLGHELFSYAVNPFYYVAMLVFCILSAALFFFTGQFFVMQKGSTNLSGFFLFMPTVSSVLIPCLCINIKSRAFDKSLKISESIKKLSRVAAALIVFFVFLIPTILVPVCVASFGDVDASSCVLGYLGIIFYASSAISFCVFLSEAFSSRASFFAFSVMALVFVNLAHNALPLAQVPDFFVGLLHSISFAWHFDSASKGIFDTRDFFYYAILTLFFLTLSVYADQRKKGRAYFSKKNPALFVKAVTVSLIFLFLFIDSSRVFLRLDFSRGKKYSLSPYTKSLVSSASEKIRITYYRSQKLIDLYPQVRDVKDFLQSVSLQNKNVSFYELDPAAAKKEAVLEDLGVKPFQVQNVNKSTLEYMNTYSCVVLEYLGGTQVIPAAFSTTQLEYDLAIRLDWLLNKKSRATYALIGNGLSFEKDYKAALDWLNLEGFEVQRLSPGFLQKTGPLDPNIPLVVFGTRLLNEEDVFEIENFIEKGGRLLSFVSPYSVDIDGSWTVTRAGRDAFIQLLKKMGLGFEDALCADISCVRANFYSAGDTEDYKYVNYPLWVTALPQKDAPYGVNFFWPAPLVLKGKDSKPILQSSDLSWKFLPDNKNPSLLYDTNPFTVQKSAPNDDRIKKEKSVLAAMVQGKKGPGLILVSGEFFVNDLLLSLSGGEEGDFRNLNFLTTSLLTLNGDDALCAIKNSLAADTSLYKIQDQNKFLMQAAQTLFVNFILSPAFIIFLLVLSIFARKKKVGEIQKGLQEWKKEFQRT